MLNVSFFFFLETVSLYSTIILAGNCYIDQGGLELTAILLLLPPKCHAWLEMTSLQTGELKAARQTHAAWLVHWL